MAEVEKPPRWQEGQRTFEVTISADKTKSGREEVVRKTLSWKVQTTRPMSDRDWIDWEIESARQLLERAERALDVEPEFSILDADALSSALNHAVTAWSRTHLGRAGPGYTDTYSAFLDEAPKELSRLFVKAHVAIHRMRWWATVTPSKAVLAAQAAVEALLKTTPPQLSNRPEGPA